MHGKRDQVIPYALGQKLFEGLTGAKEMLISETAGHSEISNVEGERYFETVAAFISRATRLSFGAAK